jgi:hypothetical protein
MAFLPQSLLFSPVVSSTDLLAHLIAIEAGLSAFLVTASDLRALHLSQQAFISSPLPLRSHLPFV